MNYQKIYQNLIEDAKSNPKEDTYKETHHIVPLCLGGTNNKTNLVRLTARQHFLAHWLLYKIHRTTKLAHAWFSMCRISGGQESRSINSHLFELCKNERTKLFSKSMVGRNNPFYGKHHSQETIDILSNIHKGKIYKTQEQIQDWVERVAKKTKTAEHRKKISRPGFIMLQNIHTSEIIRVAKTDCRSSSDEWINPKKFKKERKYKCIHCGILANGGNLKRWHNDNCKKRIL